jgi:hypothetical protein
MRAPEDLMRHANALYGRGISTIGVGIGPRCDIPALVAIDDHHGASSRMSTATDDLAEIIAADRLGLAGEAAAEARLIVDLPEGASAAVIGLKPDPAEDGRLSVPLGPMLAGARRAVTIRVTLPSGEPGTKLPVSVGFEWYGAADDEPRRLAPVALDVELATGSNNSPQCRDEAASLLALEQWRWALMSEIVRLNRDGRLREATEHLESEMKHLERYARALPQGSALVDQLRLALAVVHRPWRRHRAETADI